MAEFYEFQDIDLGYVAAVLDQHGAAYIGWERGLGKTLGSCALVDALGCERSLVVCPNTAKESVWKQELEAWLPGHHVYVMPNLKAKREQFLAGMPHWETPYVLVTHYESLKIVEGYSKGRWKNGWQKLPTWDIVIADEVHRCSNPKSFMSRALKRIPTKRKLGLSGSIIQNHAEELFSVFQWMFPDTYRRQWEDWNDRYLDYHDGEHGRICIGVKMERLADLREELGVFMVYRRKEDELDLPDKTEETRFVDLSPGQRSAYNELLATCRTTLTDGTRLASEDGVVMLGHLRQLATGLDLIGKDVADSAKLDLAVDLIRDNPDEAYVVFGWYKASLRALQDRLESSGIPCFRVDGDVEQHDRADYIKRFQAGEGRVFLGTLATLSESVTLHRASNAIFLDRHWNPSTNVQAADRIYRIGQTKPVTITYLVARDTVDEYNVLPNIANKEALRRLILGGT